MLDAVAISRKKRGEKTKLDVFAEDLEVGRGRVKHLNFIIAADDNKDRSLVMKLAALIFLPRFVFIHYHGTSSQGPHTGWTRRICTHQL